VSTAPPSQRRADPILRAHRQAAAHRRRARGVLGLLGRLGLLVVGVGALAAVFRPVFLGFLDQDLPLGAGAGGAVLRLAVVLVGLAGIEAYEAIIRGPDRDVLALLPVDPARVVRASLLRLVSQRLWLVPALAVMLLPLGLEGTWLAYVASLAALVGVLAFAWPAAASVHLLAVGVAGSQAWAPLLDLVRGPNPRGQAAFVYAPGLLLLVGSAIIYAASSGAAWVIAGQPAGWGLIALGPAVGVGVSLALPSLARGAWFRASAVLSEIDAAYAGLVDSDSERLHVYLDWALRFLPTSLRRDALHDLRHGWRGRRLWITGAWILGVLAAMAGWTSDVSGPGRALAVAILAAALVASIAIVLALDEPEFLAWWLPRDPVRATLARFLVVLAWAQPAVVPAAVVTALMSGWAPAARVLLLGELGLLAVTVLALACARLGRSGPWVYGPVALGIVAGVVLGSGVI